MLRIAICDDEKIHRLLVRDALDRFSIKYSTECEVLEFQSGKDLLNSTELYDILLLDVTLDDQLDGIEIGEQLRTQGVTATIILITAYERYQDGYKASVHRYLKKPINQDDFDEALMSAIQFKKKSLQMLEANYRKEHRLFKIDEIEYITVQGHLRLVSVVTQQGPIYVKTSWDDLITQLPRDSFFAVQSHVVVNFAFVTGYTKTEVLLHSGMRYHIAKRCLPEFERARNHFILMGETRDVSNYI